MDIPDPARRPPPPAGADAADVLPGSDGDRAGGAVTGAPTATARAGAFVHPALFYRSEREYLDGTVPFVRAGLESGEPVAVAVPGERLRLIEAELGADAAGVRLLDMREAGRNPGRILPGVLHAFADAQRPGRRVRIIGEPVWAGRTPDEYPACAQHEALINLAFRGREATILCPYDAVRLDEPALADAHATHPVVIPAGTDEWRESAAYAPEQVVARRNEPPAARAGRSRPRLRRSDAAAGPARRHRRGSAATVSRAPGWRTWPWSSPS
ncbi:anti-sigma factor RsbA family regulatory protein [Streptomyces sp. NPDC014864]|uniref:anti-sigma factor RsbA family regulatory protein n=1 Tax=Streptomyces sp. NPDC014864 TaxID=3364924 RepID=UPI0036FE5BA6